LWDLTCSDAHRHETSTYRRRQVVLYVCPAHPLGPWGWVLIVIDRRGPLTI